MTTQAFEEAIGEYIQKSRELLDQEVLENLPPQHPSPYNQFGPPYEAALRIDSRTAARYALSIGDDNPLFIDPSYGHRSTYGSQLVPGTILALLRYPTSHGVQRPQGYPVANFISGTAWEFYDVVRVGSKFKSSKVTKEFIERTGSQGNLLFLISEVKYWDFHGDLPVKCYGTQIMVPQPSMGTTRAMDVERIGESMMYQRDTARYTPEQVYQIQTQIETDRRRGADTLYWEDVQVGDKFGPLVVPPWTLQDQVCFHFIRMGTWAGSNVPADDSAFEMAYADSRLNTEWTRTHPVTRWPWTPGAEHEDALLAAYRGQPGPFDFGAQRVQIPQRLLTDWMGDAGFIRRMYIALRKPVYYADTTYYTGEVVKKYKETQKGEDVPGATKGEVEYHAVGIRIEGTNQVGEAQAPGSATVYLPSSTVGPVTLPVPHPASPPFVSYETFRRDWH